MVKFPLPTRCAAAIKEVNRDFRLNLKAADMFWRFEQATV